MPGWYTMRYICGSRCVGFPTAKVNDHRPERTGLHTWMSHQEHSQPMLSGVSLTQTEGQLYATDPVTVVLSAVMA